jgi:hypothetical protein
MKMKALPPKQRAAMGGKGREWIIKNRDYQVLAKKFLDSVF